MRRYLMLGAALAALSCRTGSSGALKAESDDDWAKRAWIDKAARALLYGASAVDDEKIEALAALPREQVVDKLMEDPRFQQTALDFNLFFLGLKRNGLNNEGDAAFGPFESHAALASAVELAHGGDYFRLFDWRQKDFMLQQHGYSSPIPGTDSSTVSDAERRQYWLTETAKRLAAWEAAIPAFANNDELCAAYLNLTNDDNSFLRSASQAGFPEPFSQAIDTAVEYQISCGAVTGAVSQSPELRQQIAAEAKGLETILKQLPEIVNKAPKGVKRVDEIVRLPVAEVPWLSKNKSEAFDISMWLSIANSSTNYNRRRAAYVLRTYFCDDLTPLNIVAPSEHVGNKHASDAGCAACHYKLDPMAAFFRDRGIVGLDFSGKPQLIHDDLLVRSGDELKKYLDTWKAPAGSGRVWDAGYVRSPTDQSKNSYGESIDDLFKIVRGADEPKLCLARRLTEYMLGVGQVFDGRWVESLANDFIAAAKPDAPAGASSAAFKSVTKTLVLSKTFSTPDPVKGECYDFAPGVAPSKLPCAVAFIVEKNCGTTCHKGASAAADLNFNDPATLAVPDNLTRVAAVLTSNDPDIQMPLNRYMDPVERASLYKWVQTQISGGAP